MIRHGLERFPAVVAIGLAVVAITACAIRLRGEDSTIPPAASVAVRNSSTADQLERCRTITYEQKDALAECEKIWAAQRKEFLGRSGPPHGSDATTRATTFSPVVPPKDESRLPAGLPSIPTPTE